MPKQIPMPEIVKSVIKGIQAAQNEYIKLTGGYWLSASPEYYITSHVAKKIGLLKDSTYVFLEPWVKGTMDEAGAISKGKLSFKTRENGKFDIVLYWSDYTPRSIIEIKNNCYYYSQIKGVPSVNMHKLFFGDKPAEFVTKKVGRACCDCITLIRFYNSKASTGKDRFSAQLRYSAM